MDPIAPLLPIPQEGTPTPITVLNEKPSPVQSTTRQGVLSDGFHTVFQYSTQLTTPLDDTEDTASILSQSEETIEDPVLAGLHSSPPEGFRKKITREATGGVKVTPPNPDNSSDPVQPDDEAMPITADRMPVISGKQRTRSGPETVPIQSGQSTHPQSGILHVRRGQPDPVKRTVPAISLYSGDNVKPEALRASIPECVQQAKMQLVPNASSPPTAKGNRSLAEAKQLLGAQPILKNQVTGANSETKEGQTLAKAPPVKITQPLVSMSNLAPTTHRYSTPTSIEPHEGFEAQLSAPLKEASVVVTPVQAKNELVQPTYIRSPTTTPAPADPVSAEADLIARDVRIVDTSLTGKPPSTLATAQGSAAKVARQIVVAIQRNTQGRSIDITLKPAELGQVTISLLSGDTGIYVSIIADRPETLELMRRNVDLLTQDFHDIGYEDTTFSFAESDKQDKDNDGKDTNGQSATEKLNTLAIATDSVPDSQASHSTRSGGLDLRL